MRQESVDKDSANQDGTNQKGMVPEIVNREGANQEGEYQEWTGQASTNQQRTKQKGPKQKGPKQKGIVLLSIIGVLLLLGLLASSVAKQVTWLLQNAQYDSRQRQTLAIKHLAVASLQQLEVRFLSAEQNGQLCYRVATHICGRFYAQQSSAHVWRFQLEGRGDDAGTTLAAGWLHRHRIDTNRVAAIQVVQSSDE